MDYWKRKRLRLTFFFFSISSLFFSISSPITLCPDSMSCSLSAKAGATYFQESIKKDADRMSSAEGRARRNMGGIGSAPPRCLWKCGSCTPCKPVHVPVPPGTPVTAEYYPEAWRCKCGNKLYMP